MGSAQTLEALRDQPFELLQELERRSRAALSGQGATGSEAEEWVGVGFRIGEENFVASRDEVREVLMMPENLTRVPGAKRWLLGLANVRGHLLPLIDMKMFLGGARTATGRSSRVISVNHREMPAGLLVDEVSGFRRFLSADFAESWPPTVARCEQYLTGSFERGSESWPVFSLHRLVESQQFLQAAAE